MQTPLPACWSGQPPSPFFGAGIELLVNTYVIAEAGVNHNGSSETALALVDAAASAGANAVKFQTFDPDAVSVPAAPKADYQLATTDPTETQRDMLRQLVLNEDAYPRIVQRCAERDIDFLSTPFDVPSIGLLDRLGVAAFKLASGEITNLFLLRELARRGKPVYLSSGMSTLGEVDGALRILRARGIQTTVLHCTSAYPAPIDDVNLRAMQTIRDALGVPVGYSDHTTSLVVPVAAVVLGAVVIEKHLTLDRRSPGPDHAASLEPPDFTAMVSAIREVGVAMGNGVKHPMPSEKSTREVARRSLVAARALPAGKTLDADDLSAKRPGTGISPMELDFVVGRVLRRPLAADELLEWAHL